MKRMVLILTILWFIILIVPSSLIATPNPVEILYSYYHVEGEIYGLGGYGTIEDLYYRSDSYNLTATKPITKQIEIFDLDEGFDMYAISVADDFYAMSNTAAYTIQIDGHGNATAVTEQVFRPVSDFYGLTINWQREFYGDVEATLYDLTDNIELGGIHYEWNDNYHFGQGQEELSFDFYDDHEYKLRLSTNLSSNEDGFFYYPCIYTDDLKAIPEPATIFLLGSGLMGLVGIKRKLNTSV